MERSEYVEICQQCKNRKMDFSKGLLCGLTNEFADFEGTCPKFDKDAGATLKHTTKQAYVSENSIDLNPNITKKLLYLILIAFGLEVVKYAFINDISSAGFGTFFTFFTHSTIQFLIWLFIGFTTNKLRVGIISGAINVVLIIIFNYFFYKFNNITFGLIPILIPLGFFAFSTLSNIKSQLKFLLVGLIIYKGIALLQSYPFRTLEKTSRMFRQIHREFDQYFYFSSAAIIVSTALTALLISMAYKWISNSVKFQINSLSLHHIFSRGQMTLFVAIFYSGILFMSFAFLSSIIELFQLTTMREIEMMILVPAVLFMLIQLVVFFFICWIYRKVTVEYYLASEKQISWNYFFAQIPVINIFFWIYNLIAFKPKKEYNRNTIASILNADSFALTIILIFLMCCKLLWIVTQPHVQALDVILIFTDLFLLILYLKHKYGMYVIIAFEILTLIYIFTATALFTVEVSESLMSAIVFFSIARLIIIYPIFHGREFNVEVPNKSAKTF